MFGALSGSFDAKCRSPNAGAAVICANFLYDPITIWATTFNLQIGLLDFKAVSFEHVRFLPDPHSKLVSRVRSKMIEWRWSFQKTWIRWVLFFGQCFCKNSENFISDVHAALRLQHSKYVGSYLCNPTKAVPLSPRTAVVWLVQGGGLWIFFHSRVTKMSWFDETWEIGLRVPRVRD